MPEIDGLTLQSKLLAQGKEIPIVFISGHGDVPQAVRAMKAGAIDFLRKPFDDTELLRAINSALSRVSNATREKTSLTDLRSRFDQLTPREKEIMFQVAEGKQNKRIAYELGVTESTVKVHRHNVMAKMQLKSLPELTLAIQRLKKTSTAERD
jgi:FixJ family two-component response regulator